MQKLRKLPVRVIPGICANSVRRPWIWAGCTAFLLLLSLKGVVNLVSTRT